MTKAVTVQHVTTLDVDDGEATRRTGQLLKYRGGLFPADMTEAQAAALARLSLLYKLDALANELSLFQGHPYLTLLGALRVANDHPSFRGLTCEPATLEERAAFRCRDDEELWIARVYRSDRDVPTVGYGRANASDDQPVARKWTQEQAQARAKRRALRDAFSLPVPGLEEVDGPVVVESEVVEAPVKISLGQTKAIHAVVRQLGITDTEYRGRLREMFGVRSSQDLTTAQAQAALEAFTAELQALGDDEYLAARAAEFDAGVVAVKEREQAGGTRARDAITLPDEPEGPRPVRMSGIVSAESGLELPALGEERDVAEEAREVFGGALREAQASVALDHDPKAETLSAPDPAALDRYASALTRANQLGIDLAPFAIAADTISSAELQELDAKLRALIAQNEPTERLL